MTNPRNKQFFPHNGTEHANIAGEAASGNECHICPLLWQENKIKATFGGRDRDAMSALSTKDLCWEIFHGRRMDDSRGMRETWNGSENLCSFCEHLRFDRFYGVLEHLEVLLDSLSEIESRQKICGVCSLIVTATARRGRPVPPSRLVLKHSHLPGGPGQEMFVVLRDEQGQDTPIVFQPPQTKWISRPINSLGKPQRLVPDLIDWSDLLNKLNRTSPPELLYQYPQGFRVIDVLSKSVLHVSKPCSYVALSYVWGPDPPTGKPFQATLGNIGSLESPGSLQNIVLPKTIQDAMEACHRLGQQYLWIDRLCIIQDEENNPTKRLQLEAMDRIYQHAFATIVAVEGDGAEFGLYGVSQVRKRPARYCINTRGCFFSEVLSDNVSQHVQNSPWNSRCWTYQEAVLSQRLLLFTSFGVICEVARQYGSPWFEGHLHGGVLRSMRDEEWVSHFELNEDKSWRYDSAITQLSSRGLTREDDILNASFGILNAMTGAEHRFGLPLNGFDEALLWVRQAKSVRRRISTDGRVFPSWSWSSVSGRVRQELPTSPDYVATWGFASVDKFMNGTIHVMHPQSSYLDRPHVYTTGRTVNQSAIAWQYGLLPVAPPERIKARGDLLVGDFARDWPTRRHFWVASRGFSPGEQDLVVFSKYFSPEQIEKALYPGRVMVIAQTATLTLRPDPRDEGLGKALVYNGAECIGEVVMDTDDDIAAIWSEQALPKRIMEFLAVCIHDSIFDGLEFPGFDSCREQVSEEYGIPVRDGDIYGELFLLEVIATENSNGVSRRLGMGTVILRKWLESGPELKAIVLA